MEVVENVRREGRVYREQIGENLGELSVLDTVGRGKRSRLFQTQKATVGDNVYRCRSHRDGGMCGGAGGVDAN